MIEAKWKIARVLGLTWCLCAVAGVSVTGADEGDASLRKVMIKVVAATGELTSNVAVPEVVITDADVFYRDADGKMQPASQMSDGRYMIQVLSDADQKLELQLERPDHAPVSVDVVLPTWAFELEITLRADRAEVTILGEAPSGKQGMVGGGDECESCIAVGEGNFAGTTADNTGSTGDDTSCAFQDDIDEWYCYTASCTGTATASLCGSGFDTALAVFDACGGAELACNDDSCGLQSELSWAVTAGVTYNVRVSGYFHATGDYTLDISCEGGGGPLAKAMSARTASLSAKVSMQGRRRTTLVGWTIRRVA